MNLTSLGRLLPLTIFLGLAAATAAEESGFRAAHARWRAERAARLTRPDGWLTLIGLHFLKDGANSVGTAADNDVVLAAGPARLGVMCVEAGGRVTLEAAAGAGVRIDGAEAASAELRWRAPAVPSRVTVGSVTVLVIQRGGKMALRVKDSEAARRRAFAGLDYFAADPSWRVEAHWVRFEKPRPLPVANVLGQVADEMVAGKAVFTREGRTFELLGFDEGPEAPVFFVIADATSGRETYGGGRHLYAARPVGDVIVLDFNRAENPPCAFTPFSTCPVPPKENRLPIAVTAGEKIYRGPE